LINGAGALVSPKAFFGQNSGTQRHPQKAFCNPLGYKMPFADADDSMNNAG
jgi:hypothetical protein